MIEKEKYPDEFLRGIPNKDFISDGQVLANAFQFEDLSREDKQSELSINWLDDEGAIQVALDQRKANGKIQFVGGIARLKRSMVKLVLTNIRQNAVSYERDQLPGNPYHGNILIDSSIEKPIRLLIMNGLALAAGTNIIPQPAREDQSPR